MKQTDLKVSNMQARGKKKYFNKIKNIISAVLVSGSIFNEAYQHLQTAVEFIINNIN